MKTIIGLIIGAALVLQTGFVQAATEQDTAAAKLATQVCADCHGRGGHSISPLFPRLAGQQSTYIVNQLEAFKHQTRGDPNARAFMWGMAAKLSDPMIHALAKYFSEQKPSPGQPGNPSLVSAGSKIFHDGIPAQQVPPCQSCHGPKAHGHGMFPRLASQHAAYIVKQLQTFQRVLRKNPLMQNVAHSLTGQQMEEVAAYLQSLP